ncbi:hypothetical protein BDV95DRAFT_603130 [Massariosphaeria phaeospora]|uniref:U4/U6 snRNA-associated-splicing factor PRP24 n=1 Tax=Massariosphaeria phaeospora TaxID=100035 RepID=A0A7C8MKM5_9PLEO|nr:hypothetical protein BDV95DRAFT_603130 [Massariosphaeria phaeospora]
MDINSLLSPQDSPAHETPPPPPPNPALTSPSKRALRQIPSRTPSGLSQQQFNSSPARQPHAAYQQQQPPQQLSSSSSPGFPFPNGARAPHSAASTPPVDYQPVGSPFDARISPSHPLYRQASTPGMDTLADLATMQHQQQEARQSHPAQRPSIKYVHTSLPLPATSSSDGPKEGERALRLHAWAAMAKFPMRLAATLQNLPRTLSHGTTAATHMGPPSPKPARVFATSALDQQHIDYLAQLDKTLTDNPFDYYSHVAFVTTLHQGLLNHRALGDGSNVRSYELLPILRDAYDTIDHMYPLGEQLWEYRLDDEKAVAQNLEERLTVLELYKQATLDEPYSAKLWVAYGNYISHLLACAWNQTPLEQWSDEDMTLGRQLFDTQLLLTTWQQGADRVKHNITDSSLVWDRYLQTLEDDLERDASPEKASSTAQIYVERLGLPHASWGDTLSKYLSLVSRHNLGDPEEAMESIIKKNSHIKKQYANREEYEFRLLQTLQQGDRTAEHHELTRYLKWEKKTMGTHSFPVVNALFERATLRFPVDPALWEDHIEFLIWQKDPGGDLVNVLERATRHCPWSGMLWSHRILTLEAENKGFDEIERVKHTATGTGLLEHTDLEELIKVQIAWCGYLRRKAFDDPKATEDDADIAEVGIRSALELVNETGMKRYGRAWRGDSKYRLERIHIKFWLQRGNIGEARQLWDLLVDHQQDSYDFWYRFYIWEMVIWANHAVRDTGNVGQQLLTPSRATEVLERGMARLRTIDQPEPLLEMYVNHCEQHESVLKVRSATIEQRRSEQTISIRRERERANATATEDAPEAEQPEGSGKRKRDDANTDKPAAKKSKQSDMEAASGDTAPSVQPVGEAPRDREHSSVIVRKLPADTTISQIRQFFTDAGKVRDVTTKAEKKSVTATVEFETPEEAEYALTKELKGFNGHRITIRRGEKTTLYVTNYPAHADDAFIRKLFSPFGELLGIRFPSLKFDTHRRFCYVQFANPDHALAATKLDGTDVEGLPIIAKISDPGSKKKRDGATAEGREIHVRKLNFGIKKQEVHEHFSRFGKIEKLNMPILPGGTNRGICFIVYESKENAEAAIAEMHGKDFWGFDLVVETASDRKELKPKIRSTIENAASPETRESTPGQADGTPAAAFAPISYEKRTLALLNVPDTVNDARIKALVAPFGFKKITLMPQHQGAIIEFATVDAVGKAELALQGQEIVDGRKIRVGTVAELKMQTSEFKARTNFIQPAQINRPVARGGARGRARGRPGLGYGRGARPGLPRAAAAAADTAADNGAGGAKSNADFRAMLLGKKSVAAAAPTAAAADADTEMQE